MFKVNEEKTLTLKDITLDGDNQGRLINVKGGTVNLESATLKNGSTEKLEQNANNDQNFSGGAILATSGSKVTITGGKFLNNNTGSKYLDAKRAAEGGAIKIDSSNLAIKETEFTGNHLDSAKSEGGRQGGAIEATKTTVTIENATFNIPGPFDTGGAIKFEGCPQANVKGSTFTIEPNKGEFGVAGGAITSENSNLTIESSTFKAGDGTRVAEAGGLIQVCLGGSFNLTHSTLEGAGAWWNGGKYTANTGGAISFYDDSSVTAKIENTTIENFMVDGNGAGIALSKGNGHSSKVNLTLTNTTIQNASAYTWQANSYGGCMYIGKGNTVKIDGGEISGQTASNVAGGIYNMGALEITGGAKITGNTGYQMVGGIYHGGSRLKIDDASFSGNQKGDNTTGHDHMLDKSEKSGINIYADEDVIITPKATFDGKDVRVFDGKSAILLTGALKNQINVSISEKEKTTDEKRAHLKIFGEDQHRKVGYVVAKGTEGYSPTAEDAKKIHYVSNDTPQTIAGPDDDKSIGQWDFVLNPKTKDVVLGQRVKVTLHANGTDEAKAKFEGVTVGRDEDKGIFTTLVSADQKEDVYDIYASGEKLAELTPTPIRKGYAFTGWYKEAKVNDDAPDENQSGKTQVKQLELITAGVSEITSILNPHEYMLYAGWEKVIPVEKVWNDNNDEFKNRPDSVKVQLYLGDEAVGNPIELTADKDWKGEFKNLSEGKAEDKSYSVKEVPEQITGYTAGVVSGDATDGFTVTNKTEFITIEGSKTWNHGDNPTEKQPTSVTVKLSDGTKEDSQTVGAGENWTWKFENLPKYKNKQEVNYTLTEAPVENYYLTQNGYDFTNTYEKKYKVSYEFVSGTDGKTLPDEVKALLPAEETGKDDGTKVTPTTPTSTEVDTSDGKWTFGSWDASEKTISGGDVTFKGTWTFTEKTSDFTLTKTVDKDTFEKAGDVLNYTVMVKNTGEKDLTGLTISDPKTTFDTPTFDLAKGDTKTFTYTYTVTENDVKEKAVNNTVTVTLGDKSKEDSTKSTLVEKTSGFTVTKTVDKTTFEKAGDVLTYTVKVKNTSENKLENLAISDSLVTLNEDSFTLDVGAEQTFTYTYTVTDKDVEAKVVNNTVTVTLGDNDPKTATVGSKLKEEKPNPPTEKVITKYVDEQGNDLIEPKDEKHPKETIPGYKYVKTEKTTKGKETTIRHIYKKVERRSHGGGGSTSWNTKPVPDDGLLNKEDHKAYMFGYPDSTFLPNRNMTREEVTAMFARLLKDYPKERRSYIIPYNDVTASDWSYEAIGFMTEKGIVKGYEDGSFKPTEAISRAEFAAMAARFDKLIDGRGNPFFDVPDNHWALASINSAAAKGWVSGYPDGSFKPERKITRSEVVSITNIMLDRFADKDFVRNHLGDMIEFTDLTEGNWAYFPIMEATNGHDYTRKATEKEEDWSRLNGEEFRFPLLYRK